MDTKRSFRLGYSDATWGDMPGLEEAMSAIAAAGWEGVEIRSASIDWLGTPRRLRSLIDQNDLVPVSMFGSLSLGGDSSQVLEGQRRRLEYAAEVGCHLFCVTGAQRVLYRSTTDDEFKRLAEMAEALVDHGAPAAVTVAYHRDGGYGHRSTIESEEDEDKLLRYAPRLGLCVDVAVSALKGDDPVVQLHKYRHRLACVRLRDWGRGKFCLLGKGTLGLDYARIRETLNDIGYNGWVMCELPATADMEGTESCPLNREYLRSVGY